jgi:iron complex outermembrane receptor protein
MSWIGGIYIEDTYKDQTTPIYIDGATLAQQLVGLDPNLLNNLVGSLGLSALGITGLPQNPINLLLYGGVETDAKAAFAEFDIDITDYISIKFGGRYSDETRVIPVSTVDARVQNLPLVGTTDWVRAFDYEEDSASWTDFTPSFGIDFDLSEEAMIYYSYTTAFKSGNFNALNINAAPSRIEPEEAESHEIGIKSDWFDGSLRLNAAVFTTTVENGHAQILSLTSGGVTRLENAAEYTIDGAELELTYNTPIDGLVVNFSGTWLDGAYDEYECTNFDPETGLEGTYDCSGNTTIRTADFAGVVDASYRFDLGRFENEVGLGAYYNSGFWFDPTNNVPEEEYAKVNARFSIRDSKSNIKLYGWGSNLTNEVSHMQRFRQDFGVGESYARPRMYGIGLEWEY